MQKERKKESSEIPVYTRATRAPNTVNVQTQQEEGKQTSVWHTNDGMTQGHNTTHVKQEKLDLNLKRHLCASETGAVTQPV